MTYSKILSSELLLLHISNRHVPSSYKFPVNAIRNPIKKHHFTISNISNLKCRPARKYSWKQ